MQIHLVTRKLLRYTPSSSFGLTYIGKSCHALRSVVMPTDSRANCPNVADDEGDRVAVTCEEQVQEALEIAQQSKKLLRLDVNPK